MPRTRPDLLGVADRSLPRTIKVFDVVDGEESYADSTISTRRGIDPAVSGRSGSSAFRR